MTPVCCPAKKNKNTLCRNHLQFFLNVSSKVLLISFSRHVGKTRRSLFPKFNKLRAITNEK